MGMLRAKIAHNALIVEDEELGCPYGQGKKRCGPWCVLFAYNINTMRDDTEITVSLCNNKTRHFLLDEGEKQND